MWFLDSGNLSLIPQQQPSRGVIVRGFRAEGEGSLPRLIGIEGRFRVDMIKSVISLGIFFYFIII